MYHLSFENGYLTFLFLGPSMDDSVFVSLLISVPRGTQHLFLAIVTALLFRVEKSLVAYIPHREEPLVMEILDLLFLEKIKTETL